jgi:hypothetical protein
MPKGATTQSFITTAVPSGLITSEWCIQDSLDYDGNPNVCGDSGKNPSDYGTICCAGDIVDTESDLYRFGNSNKTINLDTLVCCGVDGPQQGGLQPIATDRTQCTQGTPTPLASFAASNTANAAVYELTYTSASESAGESTTLIGDYIHRESPKCLWVYTKTGVAMMNVTVAAAEITTLPAPTTDKFGFPITTGSLVLSSTADSGSPSSATTPSSAISSSPSSTDASASTATTSGAAPAFDINSTACLLILAFGCYRATRA